MITTHLPATFAVGTGPELADDLEGAGFTVGTVEPTGRDYEGRRVVATVPASEPGDRTVRVLHYVEDGGRVKIVAIDTHPHRGHLTGIAYEVTLAGSTPYGVVLATINAALSSEISRRAMAHR